MMSLQFVNVLVIPRIPAIVLRKGMLLITFITSTILTVSVVIVRYFSLASQVYLTEKKILT